MNGMQKHVVQWVVLAVSLGLSLSAGRTILELWKRRDVVHERERELIKLREENASLERALQDIGQDAYLERIARDKLGLVREGETIVILPDTGDKTQVAGTHVGNEPNWKKWWRIFF